jgi:hypothetical protein
MDADELLDVKAKVDNIVSDLRAIALPDSDMPEEGTTNLDIGRTLYVLFDKVAQYLDIMIGGVELSERERVALSKNAVRSLGFTKTLNRSADFIMSLAEGHMARGRQRSRWRQDYDQDGEDGDDEGEDDGYNGPEPTREDTEQPSIRRGDRSGLTMDDRQRYGYASGQYVPVGGRDVAYLGEAVGEAAPEDEGAELATSGMGPDGLRDMGRTTSASASAAARSLAHQQSAAALSSRYDTDIQGYNVDVGEAAPPRRRKLIKPKVPPKAVLPTSRNELPTTVDGYRRLSAELLSQGVVVPVVRRDSTNVGSIRSYWIRTLGL